MNTQPAHFKPAEQRISLMVRRLLMDQPFFGCAMLHMKRVESTRVPTMAVDGVHLFWNRAFVDGMTDAELLFVLAHEVLHIALRHIPRKGARDDGLWNVATDYSINSELVAAGFTMPACGLLDRTRFAGLSSEEIYEILAKDDAAKKQSSKPASGQGDDSAADGADDGADDASGDASGAGKPGKGKPADGKPGSGADSASDPGMCGGILDAPADGDGTEGSTPASVDRDWQVRIKQAAAQAAKAGKPAPHAVRLMIEELSQPVVDWRETFRRFTGAGISETDSWSRPNRRLLAAGYYAPSRERDRLQRVLVLFDTSGSIGSEMLRLDASEAKSMLDDAGCETMQWACVDTAVRSHGVCENGEDVPAIDFAGGGGTCFASAMAWAAEQPDIACAVFFTDGETRSWGTDPGFPVLWCGHGRRDRWEAIAARAPFGESIWRGE